MPCDSPLPLPSLMINTISDKKRLIFHECQVTVRWKPLEIDGSEVLSAGKPCPTKLSHIPGPANNGGIFTNNVWPNIRQLLGRANPWDTATNKQVQDQLDRSYGKDEMDAEANVFQGLISYRTQSWRGGFPTQAQKCILGMVANSKEREAAGTATEDDYKLHTPEGMQAYIESMLEVDNKTRTKAFQRREAFFSPHSSSSPTHTTSLFLKGDMSPRRLHLGSHPCVASGVSYDFFHYSLPDIMQMERELGLWKTGEYVAPGKSQNEQFFFDQWGDCDEKATATTPKRRNFRATRFVPSIKKWTDDQWEQVNTAAAKYLDKKRKSRSVSVASSDVESVVEQEPEKSDYHFKNAFANFTKFTENSGETPRSFRTLQRCKVSVDGRQRLFQQRVYYSKFGRVKAQHLPSAPFVRRR
ncbi:hypothetical protein K438DRAFT_1782100 [Mycena galopus ATCC 62051]|nr:hypothetical protein K438DRAFT_1782100 [Mycena galopus ATCC 62051]